MCQKYMLLHPQGLSVIADFSRSGSPFNTSPLSAGSSQGLTISFQRATEQARDVRSAKMMLPFERQVQ